MAERLTEQAIELGYTNVDEVVEDAKFIEQLVGTDEDPVTFAEENGMLEQDA